MSYLFNYKVLTPLMGTDTGALILSLVLMTVIWLLSYVAIGGVLGFMFDYSGNSQLNILSIISSIITLMCYGFLSELIDFINWVVHYGYIAAVVLFVCIVIKTIANNRPKRARERDELCDNK